MNFANFGPVELIVWLVLMLLPLLVTVWLLLQVLGIRRALERIAHALEVKER